MPTLFSLLLGLGLLWATAPALADETLALGRGSSLIFATPQQGSEILASPDAYTLRMSHFDRMLRLKSSQRVSRTRYFGHMAANTLAWSNEERERLKSLLDRLQTATESFRLPLPSTILLIKTTGREEVGQGHTRANAIVLPESSLKFNDETLFFLLAHELFHVMTRHDSEFRRAAYALIGFRLAPEIKLPASIAPLQITNPDAPAHDSLIDVTFDGERVAVLPILLSRSSVYDQEIGNELGRYWSLRLMVVDQASVDSQPEPRIRNGVPVLARVDQVTQFIEQIGRNTRYIIHAEEVLAENFAFLLAGHDVPEPERVEALRKLLVDGLQSARHEARTSL
jgi:hypothetical protein